MRRQAFRFVDDEDTVGRLATFLSLTKPYKKALERGDTPAQSSEEVLALAVNQRLTCLVVVTL